MEAIWESIPAEVTLVEFPITYCDRCNAVGCDSCPPVERPDREGIVDMIDIDMVSRELTALRRELLIMSNTLFVELQNISS